MSVLLSYLWRCTMKLEKEIKVDAKCSEIALKASKTGYGVAMKLIKSLEKKYGVKTYIGEQFENQAKK